MTSNEVSTCLPETKVSRTESSIVPACLLFLGWPQERMHSAMIMMESDFMMRFFGRLDTNIQ